MMNIPRLPAEWEPHEATIMAWPMENQDSSWAGLELAKAREEFRQLVVAISRDEPVHLLLGDEQARSSALSDLRGVDNITFHDLPLNDCWVRDSGPIFVELNSQEVAATDWQFNGWGNRFPFQKDNELPQQLSSRIPHPITSFSWVLEGGSIDANGQGMALATESCLLNPNRQKTNHQEVESVLQQHLGIKTLLWLPFGLSGDHTDGHIDNIARFTSKTQILTVASHKSDINALQLSENHKILAAAATQHELTIHSLPLPHQTKNSRQEPLTQSYANFYITNNSVLVPQFDQPTDEQALEIIQQCFEDRHIQGLPSRFISLGGGSFHCLTQQIPAKRNKND